MFHVTLQALLGQDVSSITTQSSLAGMFHLLLHFPLADIRRQSSELESINGIGLQQTH